jgi:hypothetical protein
MKNDDTKSAEAASLTRDESEYLDALDRIAENAKAVGRDKVCLHVTRTREPKGRTRLGGRSGPLSTSCPAYAGNDVYAGWWMVEDVLAWTASVRRESASS